jgi:hypothetical protein
MFTFITLSLLYLLSEISLYSFFCNSSCKTSSFTYIFLLGHAIIFILAKTQTQDSCQVISTFLSHSELTRRSKKHSVQIWIVDIHYIYNSVFGNMHDGYTSYPSYPLNLSCPKYTDECSRRSQSTLICAFWHLNNANESMRTHC